LKKSEAENASNMKTIVKLTNKLKKASKTLDPEQADMAVAVTQVS